MIISHQKRPLKNNSYGDTIVEVLIATAIAAFAIGISYATAERSLRQAIAAREQNQALNTLQNQIADLRLRFRLDPNFDNKFAKPAVSGYCLDNNINLTPGPPQPVGWIYPNTTGITDSTPLTTKLSGGAYDKNCKSTDGGADYYINITTSKYGAHPNSTLYQLTVRWNRLGGGLNKTSLYFKLNK